MKDLVKRMFTKERGLVALSRQSMHRNLMQELLERQRLELKELFAAQEKESLEVLSVQQAKQCREKLGPTLNFREPSTKISRLEKTRRSR